MTCKHCARSELIVDGEGLPLDAKTTALLTCDVELVGDADSNELTRVSSKIPSALRRKVFMRDKFCCVVPGCTERRFLDVHHILHREHGGAHTMSNLCVLCFHHHKAHHDGELTIDGTAPHRLTFRWSTGEPTNHARSWGAGTREAARGERAPERAAPHGLTFRRAHRKPTDNSN